jgi:hypothetical protein
MAQGFSWVFLIYPTEKLVLSKKKMAEPFYALKSKMEW